MSVQNGNKSKISKLSCILSLIYLNSCQSLHILLQPSPKFCLNNSTIVAVVHSAIMNRERREVIRETWGQNQMTVFIIGGFNEDNELISAVENELNEEDDLVVGDFVDVYTNLTLKHILAYKWVRSACNNVDFVLKTDDDQAVDTFQLPLYLKMHNLSSDLSLLLCQSVKNGMVRRDKESKWFVSKDEFGDDVYPTYCAGWAYVASMVYVKAILDILENKAEDHYFWIDDVYMTGILRPSSTLVFDFSPAFLNTHQHLANDVLYGSLYSPELMVASDLSVDEMRRLFGKFRMSHDKNWYKSAIYDRPEVIEALKPTLISCQNENTHKTEL